MTESHNLSRRSFLKASATVVASVAALNVVTPAFAKELTTKKVSLNQLPTDPIVLASDSKLIQNAWNYLLKQINAIHDLKLRAQVLDLYKNTVPTFMANYQNDGAIKQVYAKLLADGLIDENKTPVDKLFPPLRDLNTIPQPFFSAPGSGYASHHSYPGGLVTHTAVNVQITLAILQAYQDIMNYDALFDITLAAQLLHDLAKPWVFQWQKDGSSLPEYTIAGTGAHHIFSIAESIYRHLPKEEIVAQACAHNHPGSENEEAMVVTWIKAAAILAGFDPIKLGLLSKDGLHLLSPHQQAGYIVHLGDHDWVLSVPVAKECVKYLKQVAKEQYGFTEQQLNGKEFNQFRNYIASQYSFMHLQHELSVADDPKQQAIKITKSLISK